LCAWHARSLSQRVSARAARFLSFDGVEDRYCLFGRRDSRLYPGGKPVAENRAASRDRWFSAAVDLGHSTLGLFRQPGLSGHRRVLHAVPGCFGVVPAHLNELSPPAIRGMFPGFVYQFGNFLAAGNATIQSLIADRMNHDYSVALAVVPFVGAIIIAGLVGMGREGRDVKMGGEGTAQ